jgi:protein deglycase
VLAEVLKRQKDNDKYIAAICASPALVLGKEHGFLEGHLATCYPGLESHLPSGTYTDKKVVISGKFSI